MSIEFKPDPQDPDQVAPPGRGFFTSVVDGGRCVLMSGPYGTHREAKDALKADKDKAHKQDPRAPWYAYGTCQAPEDMKTVF